MMRYSFIKIPHKISQLFAPINQILQIMYQILRIAIQRILHRNTTDSKNKLVKTTQINKLKKTIQVFNAILIIKLSL